VLFCGVLSCKLLPVASAVCFFAVSPCRLECVLGFVSWGVLNMSGGGD
jgi:hypothetical protein